MRWVHPSLIGEPTADGIRIGVRAIDLAILAVHPGHTATFPLPGRTLADAMAWADRELGPPRGAHLRAYDLPASPIAEGAPFVGHEPELAELARWYDLGLDVLGGVTATRITEARVWPHHFDLGAIIYLDAASDTRQIGVGLSPGDDHYAEPYFYVTPSPIATPARPPLAGGGFWRTEGWTGAVLTASKCTDPRAFMASAVEAARAIL